MDSNTWQMWCLDTRVDCNKKNNSIVCSFDVFLVQAYVRSVIFLFLYQLLECLFFFLLQIISLGGCSVAPECYYINIRTGTHYFPKGAAHPLGIDNANRFKCALNRIDEKQAETIQTTDYKASFFYD